MRCEPRESRGGESEAQPRCAPRASEERNEGDGGRVESESAEPKRYISTQNCKSATKPTALMQTRVSFADPPTSTPPTRTRRSRGKLTFGSTYWKEGRHSEEQSAPPGERH